MFVSNVNEVKIYNLSSGKSIPDVSNTFPLLLLSSTPL